MAKDELKEKTITLTGGRINTNTLKRTTLDPKIKFQKYTIDNDFVMEVDEQGDKP